MWVVPKNLRASNGSMVEVETIKDLAELSRICAASLFVRGKDTQSQTWLKRWKRGGWHQHLFGRIAAPSQPNLSLIEDWISSSLPIRAKGNPLQGSTSARKTLDSYGRIVESSLQQLDLFGASLKTSGATSTPQWLKSSETWQTFSTQLSQEYSVRKSVAALIRGKGYLSLQETWRTPCLRDYHPNGTENRTRNVAQIQLAHQAVGWPTPTICGNHNRKGLSVTSGDGLETASKQWPTPTVRDWKGACSEEGITRKDGKSRLDVLDNAAVHLFNPRLDQTTMQDGLAYFAASPSLHLRSDNRKLNIFFVEWLMDWPMNHTCTRCGACSVKIAQIASGCWGTESIQKVLP